MTKSMDKETFHGQSTKQNYKNDIEDSLKQKTVNKIFEYIDDYSYGTSTGVGILFKYIKDEPNLLLFQADGPKTENDMRKLLEWRRSGDSGEIGHKGGGNKRNIYGFKSKKTHIFNKLNNSKILMCSTSPNKIYELSINSTITEDDFRNRVDTSEFINVPSLQDEDDLPRWYNDIIDEIESQCKKFKANYLTRMELTKVPEEFANKKKWKEFINQIRAKQYEIPIYFKNEKLNMDKYESYKNIDLVGLNDNNKENIKTCDLYINTNDYTFYINCNDKCNDKCIDVHKQSEHGILDDNIELWGKVKMFIVSEPYLQKELDEFNNDLEYKSKQEDFYGIYLILNEKLTNYKPIGNRLPISKNNGIKSGKASNTNRFRMTLNPNKTTCKNQKVFEALIHTETIKALSRFLDKSPYREIIKQSLSIYKEGNSISKIQKNKRPIEQKNNNSTIGAVYILYTAQGVWKFGSVMDKTRLKKRVNEHRNESIEKVKEFTSINIESKNATLFYENNTESPKGDEEKIKKILLNNKKDKITMFQNDNSKNDYREYFICNDIDYITQSIIPLIKNLKDI